MNHRIEKLRDNIYLIDEFGLVNSFLVLREDMAILIDTGCGIGNIRKSIESITDKPISILLTHAHLDHAGGAYEFPSCPIYMSAEDKDLELWGKRISNEFRRYYVESRGKSLYKGSTEDLLALVPKEEVNDDFPFISLEGKDEIFGFSIIKTPAHTPGSLCFLDKESGILFSGDTVNNSIILMRERDNSLRLLALYYQTLNRLWERRDEYSVLAIGHGGPFLEKERIKEYIELSLKILNNEAEGSYEEKGFRKGEVARYAHVELWYRCDS